MQCPLVLQTIWRILCWWWLSLTLYNLSAACVTYWNCSLFCFADIRDSWNHQSVENQSGIFPWICKRSPSKEVTWLLIKPNVLTALERFSIECCKTKTKQLQCPITANINNTMNQWGLKANTCNQRQAWENACDQVATGFGFASDWLRRWREFLLNQS